VTGCKSYVWVAKGGVGENSSLRAGKKTEVHPPGRATVAHLCMVRRWITWVPPWNVTAS
jgi:hypothetical protein